MKTVRLSLFGVPPHTALNDFPAALLPAASVCDALYLATGNATWSWPAYRMLQIGNVTAALAGTSGLLDYLRLPKQGDLYELANEHATLNGVLLPMFVAAMATRMGKPARPSPLSMALLLVANLGLFVSGWKGRQMVHDYGVRTGEAGQQAPLAAEVEPALTLSNQ